MRATSLKEKDEKVVVEESFRAKSVVGDVRKEMDGGGSGSGPGAVERWVVKFEQSVNVLLTVSLL